jgi:hypothetical protein
MERHSNLDQIFIDMASLKDDIKASDDLATSVVPIAAKYLEEDMVVCFIHLLLNGKADIQYFGYVCSNRKTFVEIFHPDLNGATVVSSILDVENTIVYSLSRSGFMEKKALIYAIYPDPSVHRSFKYVPSCLEFPVIGSIPVTGSSSSLLVSTGIVLNKQFEQTENNKLKLTYGFKNLCLHDMGAFNFLFPDANDIASVQNIMAVSNKIPGDSNLQGIQLFNNSDTLTAFLKMFFEKVSSDKKFIPADHKKSWSIFSLLPVGTEVIMDLQTIMKAVITLQSILLKLIPTPEIVNFYAAAFSPLLTAFTVVNENSFHAVLEEIDVCTHVQEIFLQLASYVTSQRATDASDVDLQAEISRILTPDIPALKQRSQDASVLRKKTDPGDKRPRDDSAGGSIGGPGRGRGRGGRGSNRGGSGRSGGGRYKSQGSEKSSISGGGGAANKERKAEPDQDLEETSKDMDEKSRIVTEIDSGIQTNPCMSDISYKIMKAADKEANPCSQGTNCTYWHPKNYKQIKKIPTPLLKKVLGRLNDGKFKKDVISLITKENGFKNQ